MSKVDDGGPAANASLRDEFAKAALIGFMSAAFSQEESMRAWGASAKDTKRSMAEDAAALCYEQADAMLAHRAKQPELRP